MVNYSFEGCRPPDFYILTTQDILNANRSGEAQRNLKLAANAKGLRRRKLLDTCGDARSTASALFDECEAEAVILSSIAGGTPVEEFEHLLAHSGAESMMALSHFDEELITPEENPLGCGGRLEKQEISEKGRFDQEVRVMRYINSKVSSHDAFLQPWERAKLMAKYAREKVVLVGAINHSTGLIIPMGYIWNGGKGQYACVPLDEIGNPKKLYPDGHPISLNMDEIPEIFHAPLADNRRRVEMNLAQDPHYRERMKVQNPRFIIVTDSLLAPGLRYPGLMRGSNKVFRIIYPFNKTKDHNNMSHIEVLPKDINTVLDQLQYPILQNLSAAPGESFYDSTIVIFEANRYYNAQKLARAAMEKRWFQNYLKSNGGLPKQVFAGVVKSGRTESMYRVV